LIKLKKDLEILILAKNNSNSPVGRALEFIAALESGKRLDLAGDKLKGTVS
jgi:hypothetical protein